MTALVDLLDGPVEDVAPRLLGAVVRHGPVAVRLTEVEAYAGPDDPGSHSYRGPTARNRVMFGPPGHLYCYLSHGIHVCANISAGPDGTPSGILLRAGEVVEGVDVVRARRGGAIDRDLARGPGRLGQALDIQLEDYGADLTSGAITVTPGEPPAEVASGPRTGLRRAAGRPWRYWIVGDPTVSPYRRHPRAEGF